MKLAALNPHFVQGNGGKGYLTIDCPQCGSPPSGHRFTICTFPYQIGEGPAKRWGITGAPPDWDSVSTTPSFQLEQRCRCHFTIVNGEIV